MYGCIYEHMYMDIWMDTGLQRTEPMSSFLTMTATGDPCGYSRAWSAMHLVSPLVPSKCLYRWLQSASLAERDGSEGWVCLKQEGGISLWATVCWTAHTDIACDHHLVQGSPQDMVDVSPKHLSAFCSVVGGILWSWQSVPKGCGLGTWRTHLVNYVVKVRNT